MASNFALRFHALFAGLERAHGTYSDITLDHSRGDGKYKGKAVTKREPVTVDLWAQHLAGKYGLGIIPIRDDSTVMFGAIDVDVYADLDHGRVAASVARAGFPLVTCRSKSGGVHLYLFAKDPVPAFLMQQKLQRIAARLGHGNVEIFPKQTAILAEENDLGSWINMPFYGGDKSNRYAVNTEGLALSVEQFLEVAEAAKQPAEWFAEPLSQGTGVLPDGPPCLQHLMELGFPPGTWNSGTFNLGVYCRKAHPDDWENKLRVLNAVNFPPDKWPVSDLNEIIGSVGKKNYAYQCNEHPLKEYCDRATCRKRKYGVGGQNALPTLSSLTKLCTDPPMWFLEVENRRLKLSTSELLNPLAFQEKCANHNIIVPVIKRSAWIEYLRPAMEAVTEIPVADDGSDVDDSSAKGLFLELLDGFCNGRSQAQTLEEVSMGKPFTENGVTQFRLSDLMAFIVRKGFKGFQRHDVVAMLKDQGATNRQTRIRKRVTRLWSVPAAEKDDTPLPVPPGTGDQGLF